MITPLGALVLVEQIDDEEETKTKSGLFIANVNSQSHIKSGKIVALGTGDRDNSGNIHSIPLEVGDVVLYLEHQATEINEDGDKLFLINWNNLLAKKD